MSRILQEFYCNECDGYFLANINTGLNISIKMICPNCGHQHNRHIKDGLIFDGSSGGRVEEIMPTKATYQKTPHTEKMKRGARNGVVVNERWLEVAARERGEI